VADSLGRIAVQELEGEDHCRAVRLDTCKPASAEEAAASIAELLRNAKGLAVVGSGRASVEEQWLLRELLDASPAGVKRRYLVARKGEGDGLLISADRNPNFRGALLTGLIDGYENTRFDSLSAAVDNGSVDTIVAHNECLVGIGLTREQLRKVRVVYIGTHFCEASQYAKVEAPSFMVFEKSGSFVNQQFRLQKFAQAVPGPAGTWSDIALFSKVLSLIDPLRTPTASPQAVWQVMSHQVPQFAGIGFDSIPASGRLVDGSAFSHLPFPEGKSLHFEPAAASAQA
jgi:NADH-quinone oxidoreductase subunit G